MESNSTLCAQSKPCIHYKRVHELQFVRPHSPPPPSPTPPAPNGQQHLRFSSQLTHLRFALQSTFGGCAVQARTQAFIAHTRAHKTTRAHVQACRLEVRLQEVHTAPSMRCRLAESPSVNRNNAIAYRNCCGCVFA